jgi:hypothetical protein
VAFLIEALTRVQFFPIAASLGQKRKHTLQTKMLMTQQEMRWTHSRSSLLPMLAMVVKSSLLKV